ncbi:MAG: peroxiredoxin [Pseudomonadota bacterium]|nr:peroxiredoxin [Pseudomonadota bacterium]
MKIPAITIRTKTEEGIEELETASYFAGRKIVMFAVPGAFTPTCSAKHMPNYLENMDKLKAAGFDAVACLSVNDAHVMKAWGDATNATGQIDMLADMRAEFSRALGISADFGDVMAERAQRCALVVEDGTITHVFIEEPGMFEVSSADHVLAAIA